MKRYEPNRWCRSKEEEEEVKSPLSHDTTTTTTTTTTTRTTRTTKHIILIQIRIPKWKMSSVIILFKKKNKKIKCIIIFTIIIIIINFISIQFLKTTTRTQIRREIIKCFLYILWWFCPVLSSTFLCCLFLFLIIHLNFIRF